MRHAPHTVEDLVADWTRKYPREQGCFPPGAFRVDNMGYLKNSAGLYLQGWPVDSNGDISTDPSDLSRLRSINIGSVGGTAEQGAWLRRIHHDSACGETGR